MNEIILVNKPAGVSSFSVVSKVRGIISKVARGEEARRDGVAGIVGRRIEEGENRELFEVLKEVGEEIRRKYEGKGGTIPRKIKVGHAGTLDPFATGLLIVLIGKGTKRAGEFLKLDKEYLAEIKLGEMSSTGDPEGEIISYGEYLLRGGAFDAEKRDDAVVEKSVEKVVKKIPSRAEVERVVGGFLGESEQRVPAYSAVKINGERAYKLARKGKEVEMPVRKIKIYDIEVVEYEFPRLVVRCEVSSGTYIRALGEDIGKRLGVGAYLTGLRRTKIGTLDLSGVE